MLKSVGARSLEANQLLSDATKIRLTKAAITLVALASLAMIVYGGICLGTHTFTVFNETTSWAVAGAGGVILLTVLIGVTYLYRSAKEDLSKTKAPKAASKASFEAYPITNTSTTNAPQAPSQTHSTPSNASIARARTDDPTPAPPADLALKPNQPPSPVAAAALHQSEAAPTETFPNAQQVTYHLPMIESNEYCLAYDNVGGYTLFTSTVILYYRKEDQLPFNKINGALPFENADQLTLQQLLQNPRFTLTKIALATLKSRLSSKCDQIYDECMASPVYKTDKIAKKSFKKLDIGEFTIYRFLWDDGVTETKIRYRGTEKKSKKVASSYEGDDQEASIKSQICDLLLKGFTQLKAIPPES